MFQFLIVPLVLGVVTVSAFRSSKALGVLCGIGLFAYMLSQPLGGFIVWMGALWLIYVLCKVFAVIFL